MKANIRTIDGKYHEVELTGKLKDHFTQPNNYSQFIVAEWEELPYSQYIKPGSVILDIGANIGLFAFHVEPFAKRIICVEPTPGHMEIQKQFVKAEHFEGALNNYTGKAKFRNEPVNTTMNTLRDAPDSYEVDCITLKDLCTKYNLKKVDFCKIDIEGSEWGALTTQRISEVKNIIKSFFVELHPRTLEAQAEMAKRFIDAGYKVDIIEYNGSIYCYEA